MAIQCGRCRCLHESVADVRSCYNGGKVAVVDAPQQSRSEGPTDKQWKFLNDLREEAGQPRLGDEHRANLTRRSISEAINDAKLDVDQAKRDGNAVGRREAAQIRKHLATADYPHVTAGYYAVPSLTGNNDLDFFRVDVPTEGSWVGNLFVKRILGGGTDGHRAERVPASVAKRWLAIVPDAGTVATAQRAFGAEVGRCGRCGRTLTDEDSRARGIGPDCWAKYYAS